MELRGRILSIGSKMAPLATHSHAHMLCLLVKQSTHTHAHFSGAFAVFGVFFSGESNTEAKSIYLLINFVV